MLNDYLIRQKLCTQIKQMILEVYKDNCDISLDIAHVRCGNMIRAYRDLKNLNIHETYNVIQFLRNVDSAYHCFY